MAYKLNLKWFSKNGCEEVALSKTRIDFCFGNTKSIVSNNQLLLKELYDMGKPYVASDEEKKIKHRKKKVNGIKETASSKEEKQVSAKASEEK